MKNRNDRPKKSPRQHSGTADDTATRELLRPIIESRGRDLTEPSAQAIERYCAVPLLYDVSSGAAPVRGEVTFDSWANQPAVTLRDVVDGHIRRLKLKAGRLTFEIVAERRNNRWEFVARAALGRRVANRFVLRVGRRKLLPQTGGFYFWSSTSVPHRMRLESYEHIVIFEKLAWQ
jgi:hypothetical protein